MAMSSSTGGGASGNQINQLTVTNSTFTGAATTSIPIEVPPGRNSMAPNLALTYLSQRGNGWVGVGWNIDMGAIQRSTKFGVHYNDNAFVAIANGSSSDLVPRGDWGVNYYGAKIEGAFLKYFDNTATGGGWVVTAKNGTKYYYGSTSASRQDNNSASTVFKWCLDKVQDTNGNYMTVSYVKDQGEIYLDRIDYTGNSGLSPTNYVKFHREGPYNAPDMYVPNFRVKTQYLLRTIEVGVAANIVRAYRLRYTSSPPVYRSVLQQVEFYGNNVQLDNGTPVSGEMLTIFDSSYDPGGTGLTTPNFNNPALPDNLGYPAYGAPGNMFTGDFNGDGKSDYAWFPDGYQRLLIAYGTDNGLTTPIYNQPALPDNLGYPAYGAPGFMFTGDFNGDGKSDYAWFPHGYQRLLIAYGTDNGFTIPNINNPALPDNLGYPVYGGAGNMFIGDFNGDGKSDYAWFPYGHQRLMIAYGTDNGLTTPIYNQPALPDNLGYPAYGAPGFMFTGDFNGDGKSDYAWFPYGPQRLLIAYSTGRGFTIPDFNNPAVPDNLGYPAYGRDGYMFIGDYNGDGKADYAWFPYNYQRLLIAQANIPGHLPDLLESITNLSLGTTTIEYNPSTKYENTLLPFPVYVVKSITANDNNGNVSTTSYSYADGYYDIKDKEFRGFGYAKQTNPNLSTVETWFHQDNVFKGLVEKQEVRDSIDNVVYTQSLNTYLASTPYDNCAFPYLSQTDEYLYDGTPNYKHVAASVEYDNFGNVTRKYNHGDVGIVGDERDDRIEYYYDINKWIVSQPARTYVVIDNNASNKAAESLFTYDSANGNLLVKTDWLNGGTNPVTSFTYNAYGNRITTTDPRNNVTTASAYDATYTYPTTVTDQQTGFAASKTYDSRYGSPLTETDINGNITTYQYDVFGRPKKVINPYDNASTEGTRTIYYENFGLGTGYQRVATHSTEQSGTGNYLWNENYFDGFGRTVKTRSEGPDGKVIVTKTEYDPMGRVSRSSLPYFEGLDNTLWVSYGYDPMGRVISVTNPDGTFATKDYVLGTTVSIDANGHKKEADSDAYGRLRQVREYTGAYPNFTLYATTSYNYNVLGNLDNVIDTSGHVTTIGYDTLSRKTSMSDPDMGDWTYQYDANSNLTSQTDAKGQTITFVYDALNRLTTKRYPTGPDVTYTYDETFSTNPKGRLTTVTDLSGTTKFYYDKLGRTTKTIKTVDSVDYTTESEYDALGRTTSVTYPDPGRETVNYTYDNGGNLSTVTGYATYSNYNALGQAGLVTYGNGADTVYQFDSLNNRLFSITTNSQGQGRQNLTYAYDNVGNIQTITDLLDSNRSQGFQYDELNRLTQAQSTSYGTITHTFDPIGNITYNSQVGNYTYSTTQPHAVVQAGAYTYSYDANGNMTGRLGGTLTYDYENRLSSLTNGGSTTSFVYDASGGRVKKITPSSTTAYIGNLYECTSGVCTKHIFAGGNRIVTKNPSATYFYHTDHLRSSSVITDASGAKVEEIYYFPFGATRLNSGSVNLKHKYTGQEEDAETGLYYYGARYYDPAIGRFVSADTIIPDPTNPQAFNRYSYVLNNPLIYIDPTGHGNFFRDIAKPFEHLGHWVKEHKREVITAAIIVLAYEFGPGLIDSIQAGASDTAYLPTQVAGPDMITVETSPSAGGVRISLGKVGETIGKVGEAIGGALKSAATYIANNPGIAAIPAAAGGAYYASDAFAAGGGGNNGGSGKSAGTGNNHFQNFGNNPTHSKDHSIPWYLDMNVSYGTPIGIGPTGGIQINDSGNYPYLGGGFMFPGPSGSLTVSPMSPSPGWNFAVQGQRGISGQLGTDRFGNPFAEGGLAWKRGWSITAFYVFGPFTPIEPMPAP